MVVRLLVAAALLAPLWYWDRGLIDVEGLYFVPKYLDSRGLLQKVFDPRTNDYGMYQARELSYLLDYLDAHAFGALLSHGWIVFVPASAIGASLVTVFVFLRGARQAGLSPLTSTLLLLVYLTNYVHLSTMGTFYRSAKPVLGAALIATCMYLMRLLRRESPPVLHGSGEARPADWSPLVLFALFCLLGSLDPQGFAYVVLGTGMLVLDTALGGRRGRLVLAGMAAVAVMVVYDIGLAPRIVQYVNGYRPHLQYQRLPVERLADPVTFLHAGELLVGTLSVLLGGPACAAVCASLLGYMGLRALHRRGRRAEPEPLAAADDPSRRRWTARIILLYASLALGTVAMFVAMIARHRAVYRYPDHRLWYYPLPAQAVLLAALVPVVAALAPRSHPKRAAVVQLLLVAVVVSNVSRWDGYRRRFPALLGQSSLLKRSLREARPDPSLTPQYRAFYDYCRALTPEAGAAEH